MGGWELFFLSHFTLPRSAGYGREKARTVWVTPRRDEFRSDRPYRAAAGKSRIAGPRERLPFLFFAFMENAKCYYSMHPKSHTDLTLLFLSLWFLSFVPFSLAPKGIKANKENERTIDCFGSASQWRPPGLCEERQRRGSHLFFVFFTCLKKTKQKIETIRAGTIMSGLYGFLGVESNNTLHFP